MTMTPMRIIAPMKVCCNHTSRSHLLLILAFVDYPAAAKRTRSEVDTSVECINNPVSPSPAPKKHKKAVAVRATFRAGRRVFVKPVLKTKHLTKTTSNDEVLIDETNEDGFLVDVAAAIASSPTQRKPTHSAKTLDIHMFFQLPYTPAGSNQLRRKCTKCG